MKKGIRITALMCLLLLSVTGLYVSADTPVNGWKTKTVTIYYQNGKPVRGIKKIGKNVYLFDEYGHKCETGIYSYGGKKYFTRDGIVRQGLVKWKGASYYSTWGG